MHQRLDDFMATVSKSASLHLLLSDEIVSSIPYAQDTLQPLNVFGGIAP